ncbi:hypothetical protein Cal6303_0350 [Calothrix sp. PCC 6303]|nr:hypothetical protein Cal6303_0350 [Calothrix sp. PCC 6303]
MVGGKTHLFSSYAVINTIFSGSGLYFLSCSHSIAVNSSHGLSSKPSLWEISLCASIKEVRLASIFGEANSIRKNQTALNRCRHFQLSAQKNYEPIVKMSEASKQRQKREIDVVVGEIPQLDKQQLKIVKQQVLKRLRTDSK